MSSARSVTATFTLPDLTITKLTILPSAPYTNDDIHVSVDVANLTGADSTTFRIEFYVDHIWQSCWDLGNPPEYFARVASLAGNSSGSWTVTIPAGTLSAGTHTISAYVDMGCEVAEGNEANNKAGPVSVTVSVPPVAPPGHDDFNSARTVTGTPYTDSVDVRGGNTGLGRFCSYSE